MDNFPSFFFFLLVLSIFCSLQTATSSFSFSMKFFLLGSTFLSRVLGRRISEDILVGGKVIGFGLRESNGFYPHLYFLGSLRHSQELVRIELWEEHVTVNKCYLYCCVV